MYQITFFCREDVRLEPQYILTHIFTSHDAGETRLARGSVPESLHTLHAPPGNSLRDNAQENGYIMISATPSRRWWRQDEWRCTSLAVRSAGSRRPSHQRAQRSFLALPLLPSSRVSAMDLVSFLLTVTLLLATQVGLRALLKRVQVVWVLASPGGSLGRFLAHPQPGTRNI
ncbi:hypothetical protein E2C01_044533 [Portunus trituberculatus]|uniref:Uncharacterized protein n=1 Tax=Portunus trituberculatus TaxID=210409 RepID=A0A5B7G2L3_PORTR|nr:hypothetical protein [Portunus trituberculatus]